jgi:organic radical activating enzyme
VASANLVEIFSSIQGEGPSVGFATLFVRFGRCDLRCRWCDSPHTWRPASVCRIETGRGTGRFRQVANPVPLDEVLAAAEALELAAHPYASLTGGEPLLQPQAVGELAREIRARGPRVLLETHGLAVEALEEVIDAIDLVSMDWKLSSDVWREHDPPRERPADFHGAHVRFLEVARRAPEVVVKLVVTPATEDAEIDAFCAAVAGVDPATPVVLQPVTPAGAVREAPSAGRLLALMVRVSRDLPRVRVIPQTHRLIGAP